MPRLRSEAFTIGRARFGRTARNRRNKAMGVCNHQAHMARRPA